MKNNLIIGVLILISTFIAYNYFFQSTASKKLAEKEISYTKFLEEVEANNITKVIISGNLIRAEAVVNNSPNIVAKEINSTGAKSQGVDSNSVGVDKASTTKTAVQGVSAGNKIVYLVAMPMVDSSLLKILQDKNIEISGVKPETGSGIGTWIFVGLIIFFIIILFRSLRGDNSSGTSGGGGSGPFSFGKSKARLISPKDAGTKTFKDVAGVNEAKEDLQELVDFLKNPKKFEKLGAKIPKGCLLVGSPGTGKTLLAKAVAGEAGVPFFSISGSDFVEMFVGVGASRVRDLFNQAKKQAPCIIFIDEIDAVGRQRGVGVGGGNDEREQTLNQLLVEMDGFTPNQGIIVLAATNRADVLDKALLRPGRFDRQVVVPLPDLIGREKILQIYLAKIPLEKDFNIGLLARGTTGFSGADLANLVNEATILAGRRNKEIVTMDEFEEAKDKILMGAERKTSKMSEDERTLTAYHEAGHALVSFIVKDYYPVHKVTIIPRGRSLGVTSFMPERDEYSRSYKQLVAQLAVLFGGRISEELMFGKDNITTGAAMDIQMATNVARRMVMEWGFSDSIGRIKYTEDDARASFYGNTRVSSEQTSKEIEEEIKKLIDAAEKRAREILITHAEGHKRLSEALLEYETLTGEEAQRVCDGMSLEEARKVITEKKSNEKVVAKSSLPEMEEEVGDASNSSYANKAEGQANPDKEEVMRQEQANTKAASSTEEALDIKSKQANDKNKNNNIDLFDSQDVDKK